MPIIRCAANKLTADEIKSLQEENIPTGYELYEAFDPTKRIIAKYIIGILLAFFTLFLILFINSFIRPEFNGYEYGATYLSLDLVNKLLILFILILLALATTVVHEALHGLVYYYFTRKRPQFGCRGGNPYAALAFKTYLNKNMAALAAITPLAISSLIMILWQMLSIELLPYFIAVVTINVGLSTADIASVSYFLLKPKDVLIGFDGYSGAVYKPIRPLSFHR